MAVVIYPQGWLHNANVYGFLKVINAKSKESKLSFKLPDILKDDGTIVLTDKMLDELYTDAKFDGIAFSKLFTFVLERTTRMENNDVNRAFVYFKGNVAYYENYIANMNEFMKNFVHTISTIFKRPTLNGPKRCFLCGNPLETIEDESILQRKQFSRILFKEFSSSSSKFPNSFWNATNDLYLCDICSQMALFRHFVFPRKGESIFVNVPSFKSIWYLNEAVKAYQNIAPDLSLSRAIVEVHLKLQRLLGIWEKQNIEIIHYNNGFYKMYYLPHETVDLLLNARISSILSSLNNMKIFEVVIYRERTNELLELEYLLLKYLLDIGKGNTYLKQWNVPSKKSIVKHYTVVLNDLFQETRRTMGVTQMVPVRRMRTLGQEASRMFERTRYRLLELIRLAKKDGVYHLLLKTYMAHKMPFPEELNGVFSLKDEDFKNLMFAYMSGIISGGEENE